MGLDPGALLTGPRGRRLCWELLAQTGGWGWREPPESAGAARLGEVLAVAVARSELGGLAVAREPASFLSALADAVTWAMYWQEADDWDRRLADPRVAEQLWPVAEAVRAGDAHTMLAGWDPDETWWLTDSPRRADAAVGWVKVDDTEPFAWAPSTD